MFRTPQMANHIYDRMHHFETGITSLDGHTSDGYPVIAIDSNRSHKNAEDTAGVYDFVAFAAAIDEADGCPRDPTLQAQAAAAPVPPGPEALHHDPAG